MTYHFNNVLDVIEEKKTTMSSKINNKRLRPLYTATTKTVQQQQSKSSSKSSSSLKKLQKTKNKNESNNNMEDKARVFYGLAVVKDCKYRFRTYRSVFVGKEMVDSMVGSGLCTTRKEAVTVGRILAKRFNLFQNIENNIMNKTIPFEDSSSKFYRFSVGALKVIKNIEEQEHQQQQQGEDNGTVSTSSSSSSSNTDEESDNVGSINNETGNTVMDVSVFKKKKKKLGSNNVIHNSNNNTSAFHPLTMQTITEEQDDSSTAAAASVSTNTRNAIVGAEVTRSFNSKEITRLEEIQQLAREQAEFEKECAQNRITLEEKERLEKDRIDRLRMLAKEQLELHRSSSRRRISASSALSLSSPTTTSNAVIRENEEEEEQQQQQDVIIDTKERIMADIVRRLQRNHSQQFVENCGALMTEIDTKVASMYTGHHHITESPFQDNSVNEGEIEYEIKQLSDEEQNETVSPAKKKKEEVETAASLEIEDFSFLAEDDEDDEVPTNFVLSPNDLPKGLRRQSGASIDAFESMVTKNSKLNYTNGIVEDGDIDDNQSAWTEYIIDDKEGREEYRLNDIRRNRPSFTSTRSYDDKSYMEFTVVEEDDEEELYDEETIYDDETLYNNNDEEETLYYTDETVMTEMETNVERLRKNMTIVKGQTQESKKKKNIYGGGDNDSYMDMTVFDNDRNLGDNDTVQVSYIEDDRDYIPPPITSDTKENETDLRATTQQNASSLASLQDQMNNSFPVIFANTNNNTAMISLDDDFDDNMTQITMDHAIMDHGWNSNINTYQSSLYPAPPNLALEKDTADDVLSAGTNSSASASAASTTKSGSSTSKKRIQQILWNDLYSCDIPLVRCGMEELRSIVVREPECRKHIVRLGGGMAIMGILEEYFEVEMIQYLCLVVLELLAAMEPEARKVINDNDGIQLIVRSMQDQPNSERVQQAGRACLATVCQS